MNKMIKRMDEPTPKFFKTLCKIGVALVTASAVVAESHAALPPVFTNIASYMTLTGTVLGAVSQSAVLNEKK